jgi:serine protease Do
MRRFLLSFVAATTLVAALVACTGRDHAGAEQPARAGNALFKEAVLTMPAPAESVVPGGTSLAPLIERLKPAVVNISTTTVTKHPRIGRRGQLPDGLERFFGLPGPTPGQGGEAPDEMRGQGLGSGFVLNEEGYILTNNHVVANATDIRVKLADDREFVAKVVGKDPLTDVALIKLNAPPKDLPTVVLGDSDGLRQGDFVLALGSPFGLSGTATLGIVSAKHRGGVGAGGSAYDDFLQTDAAINPGNSGGPLFNMRGEVVGINTAIINPQIGSGIGFAVPISLAKALLPQLKGGKVVRGYVGVGLGELTPDLAQAFGLPAGTKGALVQQVMPKTPAEKAGLEPGDVITSLDGKPVESSAALSRGVALVPPGKSVTLGLVRKGSQKTLSLNVAQRPENEGAIGREDWDEGQASGDASKTPKLGFKVAPLNAEVARELQLPPGLKGVVVADVVDGGPAEQAGVQRGDIILEFNQKAVTKPGDLTGMVDRLKEGDLALLRIRRGNVAIFVAVPVGGRK